MYDALTVARYIISTCTQNSWSITNLKLQKLLYYIWIDYFRATNEYLFDNDICAWPLGPVVPDVYDEFCAYGGLAIRKQFDVEGIGGEDRAIIEHSLRSFNSYTASQLVDRSHAEGKPWDTIFRKGLGKGRIIPFDLIIEKECQ